MNPNKEYSSFDSFYYSMKGIFESQYGSDYVESVEKKYEGLGSADMNNEIERQAYEKGHANGNEVSPKDSH